MSKEQIHIEYNLERVTKNSVWSYLASADGLAKWFADDVSADGNIFSFTWKGHASEAELLGVVPFAFIRFRWLEEDDDTFFEFRLHRDELTCIWLLEIIDFAEPHEKEETVQLWNTQVKVLKRKLGVVK